jgi:hypothetical protein
MPAQSAPSRWPPLVIQDGPVQTGATWLGPFDLAVRIPLRREAAIHHSMHKRGAHAGHAHTAS